MSADSIRRSLRRQLAPYQSKRIFVAYSGGADSHALLHAMHHWRCGESGFELIALHANHCLHQDSGSWVRHCEEICSDLGIALISGKLTISQGKGQGLEAAARNSRYHWFATLLQDKDLLLTAHHMQDQSETFLLRLLRGGGTLGLNAMPESRKLGAGLLLRPFLETSKQDLDDYVKQHNLSVLVDPSNADQSLDRNRLRAEILPRIKHRWPGLDNTIARTIKILQQDQQQLDHFLKPIYQQSQVTNSGSVYNTMPILSQKRLRSHPPELAIRVLRYWLRLQSIPMPSYRLSQEIIRQVMTTNIHMQMHIRLNQGATMLRSYRQHLFLVDAGDHPESACKIWNGGDDLRLTENDHRLQAITCNQGGLRLAELSGKSLTVAFRQGGERVKLNHLGHRSLKKIFQDAGIPPWERKKIPLLYLQDSLVAIANIGVVWDFQATANQPAVKFVISHPVQHSTDLT